MTRDRIISVTRRHLEFLFGDRLKRPNTPNQARVVERIIKRNRLETVVTREPFWWPMVAPPLPVEEEGGWQLPPSDESKVGED